MKAKTISAKRIKSTPTNLTATMYPNNINQIAIHDLTLSKLKMIPGKLFKESFTSFYYYFKQMRSSDNLTTIYFFTKDYPTKDR